MQAAPESRHGQAEDGDLDIIKPSKLFVNGIGAGVAVQAFHR
ncbi:hypothetical protein ES703_106491 [subsurface metagenome]